MPAVTNNSTVVAPPRLADAEVQAGGNEIYLGFSLALDVPATVAQALKDAFTVTVDGVERAFDDLEFFGLGNTFVKLVFTETLIAAGTSGGGELRRSPPPARARWKGRTSNKVTGLHHRRGRRGGGHQQFHGVERRDAQRADREHLRTGVGGGLAAVALTPAFDSAIEAYSASVPYNLGARLTFMPAPSQTGATVDYFDADDMALADAGTTSADVDVGHQVDTAVGANTIKVKVTAPDKTTTKTYTVTVTRELPTPPRRGGADQRDDRRCSSFNPSFRPARGRSRPGRSRPSRSPPTASSARSRASRRGSPKQILDITLSTAIYKDQAVVVSYDSAAAGGDALEDRDGNAFQSFTSGEGGVVDGVEQIDADLPDPVDADEFHRGPRATSGSILGLGPRRRRPRRSPNTSTGSRRPASMTTPTGPTSPTAGRAGTNEGGLHGDGARPTAPPTPSSSARRTAMPRAPRRSRAR